MKRGFFAAAGLSLVFAVLAGLGHAGAANNFPDQSAGGSIGLQGEISQAAPTQAATITVPSNGASFSSLPITVSGLCPANLLIKIFSNNVFVGSTFCSNGSYSLQVDLFNGQNQLVARDYDALDQAGPDSNTVNVTFNDVQFAEFGTHVELTSAFAERGAPPNQELDWPVILSGGTGPYAVSVDWGDGSPSTLFSQAASGTFTIKHSYKSSGIYTVIIKATDKNNGTAFLQVIAVASGAGQNNAKGGTSSSLTQVKVLWWPALLMIPLIVSTFWVGRRYELYVLRKQLEKERDNA